MMMMMLMMMMDDDSCQQKQQQQLQQHTHTGFGLGAMFGLFITSFDNTIALDDTLTTRQKFRATFFDMGRVSWKHGKNFAMIGGIFATVECFIEKVRVCVLMMMMRMMVVLLLLLLFDGDDVDGDVVVCCCCGW